MKFKSLFIITSIIFLINGIISVFFPSLQLSIYDIEGEPGAMHMAQWSGLGSLFIGVLTFLFRNVADKISTKILAFSLIFYFIVSIVLSILGTIDGILNYLGWAIAGVSLILLIIYSYFLFLKK